MSATPAFSVFVTGSVSSSNSSSSSNSTPATFASRTGTITDVSDERLKENIRPLDGALALLAHIDGKSFNMKGSTTTEFGFIAQNVQLVLPEAVSVVDPDNGYLGVSYLEFIPWLVEAINELASKVSETAHLIIATLTAHRVETDELRLKDGGGTSCYTRSQLDAMVAGSAAAGVPTTGGAETPAASSTSGEADADTTTVTEDGGNGATTSPATDEEAARPWRHGRRPGAGRLCTGGRCQR